MVLDDSETRSDLRLVLFGLIGSVSGEGRFTYHVLGKERGRTKCDKQCLIEKSVKR